MNKIIFEVAGLAFCVSAVLFGVQGGSIVDIISRSFLVFVGVVLLIIIALVAVLVVAEKSRETPARKEDHAAPSKKDYASMGKNAQPAAH